MRGEIDDPPAAGRAAPGWSRLTDGYIRPPDALELIVSDHCNIACRQCNHASPVMPKWNLQPADALAQLSVLAAVYRPRRVKLIGGEPLLNPRLAEIMAAARASGVSERLTLITNGLLLPRLADAAWALLDEIEISQYPNAGLTQRIIDFAFEKGERTGVAITLNRFDSFRHTFSAVANDDPALVAKVFAACKMATIWGCHAVYKARLYRCPQSIYAAAFAAEPGQDGIALARDDGFQARLLAFLNRAEPLAGCRHCVGSCGVAKPHGLAPRKAWAADLALAPAAMIDHALLERSQRRKRVADDCKVEVARRPPPSETGDDGMARMTREALRR